MFKRTCVITALTAAVFAGGTGLASAAEASVPVSASAVTTNLAGFTPDRPVPDPVGTPYCGPGRRWEHGHCRSKWLQVSPPRRQSSGGPGGIASALAALLALGALI